MLVDINKWYSTKDNPPKKKGRYLLMIGVRELNHLNISVTECNWNSRDKWNLPEGAVPMQWKYITNSDKEKYIGRKEYDNRNIG